MLSLFNFNFKKSTDIYLNYFKFFFISNRTTKIVSNNCLINEYKDGNTCNGIYILIYSLILKKDEKYMFYSRLFQFNIRILSFNRSFYIKKSGVNIFFRMPGGILRSQLLSNVCPSFIWDCL